MESPVTVLLVDDSPAFLAATVRFLEVCCQAEVATVGTAGGAEEALLQAQRLRLQVVLLDLSMPGLSGLEVLPRLREALPESSVIVLTMLDTDAYRQAALAARADEFVSKSALLIDLLPAIRRVARRRLAAVGKVK